MNAFLAAISFVAPLISIALGISGWFGGKTLWRLSAFLNFFGWLALLAFFLTRGYGLASLSSPNDGLIKLGAYSIFTNDYIGALLSLAASSLVLILHFAIQARLVSTRSNICVINGLLLCSYGVLSADNLLVFALFWVLAFFVRAISLGIERSGMEASPEHGGAFWVPVFTVGLFLGFLMYEGTGALPWVSGSITGPAEFLDKKDILFFWVVFAGLFAVGVFPFHGVQRKTYELLSPKEAVALALFPLFLYRLFFHFVARLFPTELALYSTYFLGAYSFVAMYSAINLSGAKSMAERAFWLQQIFLCLVLAGFFSLTGLAWLGAVAVLFYMIFAVPLAYLLASYCTRHSGVQFSISVLAAWGFPISLGFWGGMLILWNIADRVPALLGFLIPTILLLYFNGAKVLSGALKEGGSAAGMSWGRDSVERNATIVLLLILCAFGFAPKLVTTPMEENLNALILVLGTGK